MKSNFARLVVLVARRDYLRTVRRRGFVAGTLLLPLAMGFIFAISAFSSNAFSEGSPTGPIVVVNESSVPISASALTPDVTVVDKQTADQQLADRQVSEYFLVPSSWPGQPTVMVVTTEHTTAEDRSKR